MSLSGNLADLGLTDIFQIVVMSRKSGVLRLDQGDGKNGKLIFVAGRVAGAWSYNAPEVLADALTEERITLPNLVSRLREDNVDPLSALKAIVSPPLLPVERSARLLERFTKDAALDLLRLKEGTFVFEPRGNLPSEPPLPEKWLLVPEGLDAQYLELEGARIGDEARLKVPPVLTAQTVSPVEIDSSFDLARELSDHFEPNSSPPASLSPGLAILKSMLFELHRPTAHTHITLLVLRYASTLMNRAILFEVHPDTYIGLGEFGISGNKDESAELVRNIRIPRKEKTPFTEIEKDFQPQKIKLDSIRPWDLFLVDMLGGEMPVEAFIGPIVLGDRMVGILYGDNLPEHRAIGDTESLEIFLSQAGIALEQALAGKRVT